MTQLEMDYMWRHTWPSAEILCNAEFIATNRKIWNGKTIMEIGAGVAALPSMTALRCGASKVIITEQTQLKKAFKLIQQNLEKNFEPFQIAQCVRLMGFDWKDLKNSIEKLLNETTKLDYVFGSDVFYDPLVFESLVNVILQLLKKFPNMEFYFAYQIRDSDWSVDELLISKGLQCTLIRCVDTKQHSIFIAKIHLNTKLTDNLKMSVNGKTANNVQEEFYFAGIEGGATHSTLVLIDSFGNKIGEWTDGPGLNCLLNGLERTADQIAKWIRETVTGIPTLHLPLASLGMGLSGAEDEGTNNRMLRYLKEHHGDLTDVFFLTTDSIAAVATSFQNGGIVLIAGTGSTCRLLKADGKVYGVGGWGHLIGDGASGFWITMRAVRHIFDCEDGLLEGIEMESEMGRIATVKEELLRHFKISTKLALLDIIYNPNFSKSFVASFCKRLSELAAAGDNFAIELFVDAGEILAQHIAAISRHFDEAMFHEVPIIMIGSVFKSWAFMRQGFEKCLNKRNLEEINTRRIHSVTFYQLECSPAIGAAILSSKMSKKGNTDTFNQLQSKRFFDKLMLT